MKHLLNKFKIGLFVITLSIGMLSCEDFLNRPDPSAYTTSQFFQNDEQCLQAANILYSSPWHDFTRGWLGVGDVMSGNYLKGFSGYWKLTLSDGSVDQDLSNMSASLWAVIARANGVLENINMYAGSKTTEVGRNTAKGEALVWKAMAYFYLVRIYGAVPIIHSNSDMMASGDFNSVYRAKINNVYDYIIMTLEKAIEWLPETNQKGRIDRYSAYALLAKVYLTKSGYGRSGDRNQEDLDKAKQYAAKVIHESGRSLEPVYSNIFRGSYNFTPESLIAWRWIVSPNWTASNPIQSEIAFQNFYPSDCWGDWGGPSLDLQAAFGENALRLTRNNTDVRRKATMMMYGDVYEYFWRDHPTMDKFGTKGAEKVTFSNGFDWTVYQRDVLGEFRSPTGSNGVKHVVGNDADHQAELGTTQLNMSTGLATHILRLADIYLVYAEAILGNASSTSDGEALAAFNAVRHRAGVPEKNSITFEDIFKERRLELAFEGDYWYDFVRLAYYKPEEAVAKLNAQNRKQYAGLSYAPYFIEGVEGKLSEPDDQGRVTPRVDDDSATGQPYPSTVFNVPFPITDLKMNPHLNEPPVDYDISQYKY